MINLNKYPRLEKPTVTRIARHDKYLLRFVMETNQCESSHEIQKIITWKREYGKTVPIPEELRGHVPDDTDIRHAFVISFYDKETLERIISDAFRDPHLKMQQELEQARLQLQDDRINGR